MRLPVDQAARDLASRDLETSVFLEASAGTGKTRILVDRVVEIIRREKASIDEIVVITFTEKAAGELRGRIREELHRGAGSADPVERSRCQTALRALDNAHIETIHAFASSVLREHPLQTGIDPNFRQLDEVGNELDFQERWSDWIWGLEGGDYAAVERCLMLGMGLPTVREVARVIQSLRELSLSRLRRQAPNAAEVLQETQDLMREAEALSAHCRQEPDTCLASFRDFQRQISACQLLEGQALERALRSVRVKLNQGRAGNWQPRESRQDMLDLLKAVWGKLETYRDAINEAALGDLARSIQGFVRQAARGRQLDGALNFEDLLIEARELIAGHADVRRAMQRRFRFILVDEFQDTDPLQAELIFLLAASEDGGPAAASFRWTDVVLAPGKLFLVGDPKQSIYRFRRADVDTYSEAKRVFERHEEAGEPARLATITQNFRSQPLVAAWVNDKFERVIRPNPDFPNAQPDYKEIDAYRQAGPGAGVLLLYPSGVVERGLPKLRGMEATAIAEMIGHIVRSDEWRISDPNSEWQEDPRPIEFRDICLLVENRTAIDVYTVELANRNIPFILDGGHEFFQRQEVRELAAILRVLDDATDEVSLVAALKSQAFACSDVELLEYRRGRRRFSLFSRGPEGPVDAAISQLRDLYDNKANLSLPAFVDRVIRECFLVEPLLLRPSDRQRAANLKGVVERAAEFAANEVDSLRPFIRWLSQRQTEGARETESQLAETDDDVVRVMTIHGAKGLEFPVVIMAKLSAGESRDREKRVVDREEGRVEFEVGKSDNRFRTPGFAAASARERAYERAQEARLMYVAATRARDLLVVSAFRSDDYPGKFVYLPGLPSWESVVQPQPLTKDGLGAAILLSDAFGARRTEAPAEPVFTADIVPAWLRRRERLQQLAAGGPRFVVPSMLVADEVKEPRESEPKDRTENEQDLDVQDDTDRALGAAEGAAGISFVGSSSSRLRGSVVHEVLFRCDLADPPSAGVWARRLCQTRGLPHLAVEVEEHARRILASSPMQRVLRSKNVLRELPVAWFDEPANAYTEGFVDLAFEEEDGWVIADYKTDRVDGAVRLLAERYRAQVDAYRRALLAAGVNVKEASIWLSATGELVAV